MKLSEMREILASGGIQLTKSLGQNFLHDTHQLRRIVAAAELESGDPVLEIGPGLGPLTELLAAKAGRVVAIEKDKRLINFLRGRFEGTANLELLHADALEYLRKEMRDWSDWKMVSNLPYSVGSPILVELAEARSAPERMVATLQLEVAERITAAPGSAQYGLLTLLLGLRYQPSGWFRIPAGCFFPAPDVDSACVTLMRRKEPLLAASQSARFKRLVKRAFSQRRKMMLKLLKADWPRDELTDAFRQIGIPPQARAEQVGLEQFVELTRLLSGRA